MDDEEIKVFADDDHAYEEWVGRQGGYVLTERNRRGEYMLHDSGCSHLGKGNEDLNLTRKPRQWAKQRRILVAWTERETGTKPLSCRTCM
jgi:hypothetical protein